MFLLTAIGFINAASSPAKEAADVRKVIDKVNTRWQNNHKPEATAFWHVAAYHTGNMEAYKLTGNPDYLDYSLAWAEHNGWQGAKGKDRSKWKYATYGEGQDHVLFGDWQICFQTYADLYNELPDDRRIKRAREVMEYQMSTPLTRAPTGRRISGRAATAGCSPALQRYWPTSRRSISTVSSSRINTAGWPTP